jgi:hypothetical protein
MPARWVSRGEMKLPEGATRGGGHATMDSVVHIRNVPSASSGTMNGNRFVAVLRPPCQLRMRRKIYRFKYGFCRRDRNLLWIRAA